MLEPVDQKIVTLIVEDKKILCPRACLVKYEYFKAMLTISFRESKEDEISIKEVSFEKFEQVIKFIKGESVEITFNNLGGLLDLADQFLIIDLKQKCVDFIKTKKQSALQRPQSHYPYHLQMQSQHNQSTQINIQNISISRQVELIDIFSRVENSFVEILFELIETNNGYRQNLSGQQIVPYLKEAIQCGYSYAFNVLLKKYDDNNSHQRAGLGYANHYQQNDYLSLPMESNNRCLLDIAMEKDQFEMVLALLARNVFINYCFYYGEQQLEQFSPLSFAAFLNNAQAVKLLLGCFKGNTNQKPPQNHSHTYGHYQNNLHYTALHYAVEHHNLEMAEMLLEYSVQDLRAGDITPFHLAFGSGDEKMINLFLKYGADPAWGYEKPPQNMARRKMHSAFSQQNENKDNFFHYAAKNCLSKTVVYLFDKPKGLSEHNHEGKCPLHIALELNDEETITVLFNQNPRVCDSNKRNILHYICLSKTKIQLLSLLDKIVFSQQEFTLFIKDNTGKLPIHYAMEACLLELTQYLIDHGAMDKFIDGNAFFDNNKKTPLDLACDKGQKEFIFTVIKYIVDHRSSHSPQIASRLLFWAATREYYDIVDYLVREKNTNVNLFSAQGDSFLHWAARKGRVEATKFLIQHKIEVNHVNAEKRTALHEAAEAGHYKVVKVLLQSGCKASFWDNSGKTALQLAESERQNSSLHSHEVDKTYDKTIELLERSECPMQ